MKGGKTMAEVTLIPLSLLICEQMIEDKHTGKPSIIGLTQAIVAPRYPTKVGRLTFYFELTGGHGTTDVKIALVDVQNEDKALFEGESRIQFGHPKDIVWRVLQCNNLIFPHPGEYRFQLCTQDGVPILEKWIVCRELRPKNKKTSKNNK
jgi:hypothetical protein